jgi:hypothetical protein
MIESRFKRSAFHGLLGFVRAESLACELAKLLQGRLQGVEDSVAEAKQIIEELGSQGHRLKLSEPDSSANLQVWLDGDFAIWFWADSPPKDVTRRIDRVEVLWQKM